MTAGVISAAQVEGRHPPPAIPAPEVDPMTAEMAREERQPVLLAHGLSLFSQDVIEPDEAEGPFYADRSAQAARLCSVPRKRDGPAPLFPGTGNEAPGP